MEPLAVTAKDVEAALDIVREVAHHTPTVRSVAGGEEVYLKLESLQRLGAFKIRGAWNRFAQLSQTEREAGVSTLSSGNHGRAVAWAARRLGLRCVVRVPEGATGRKVEAIRGEGATVTAMPRGELVRTHEEELWRRWPETFIHPFAHPLTIAGQGTAGWELAEDAPDVRTVLVPVGGGGLASGIAVAVKSRLPRAKVFGVQAEGAAPLPEALRTGRPAKVAEPRTIADGIRIGLILPAMLPLLSGNLDGCLLVTDGEIRAAMRTLAMEAHVIAEPAGAAAVAAWIRHRGTLEPPVAAIVSGGNAEPSLLEEILSNRPDAA